MEIQPAYEETALRIEFWGDEIERIVEVAPLTGEVLAHRDRVEAHPGLCWITFPTTSCFSSMNHI